MGNASSTVQKINNIIKSNTDLDASAVAKVNCAQHLKFKIKSSRNCSFRNTQECSAMANASLDVLIQAFQKAELDEEAKQAVDGLALGMNISTKKQETRNEVITNLAAKCRAQAETNLSQVQEFDLGDIDCTELDTPFVEQFQYGDAGADCVVKAIVDQTQEAKAKAKTDQLVEGPKLPDSGMSLMMIAGVAGLIIRMGTMGGGGGDDKGGGGMGGMSGSRRAAISNYGRRMGGRRG
jgi:hypothetical protein